MALIRELAMSEGQTVLLVTHSLQAAQAADYVWTMRDGQLIARTERMTELATS